MLVWGPALAVLVPRQSVPSAGFSFLDCYENGQLNKGQPCYLASLPPAPPVLLMKLYLRADLNHLDDVHFQKGSITLKHSIKYCYK